MIKKWYSCIVIYDVYLKCMKCLLIHVCFNVEYTDTEINVNVCGNEKKNAFIWNNIWSMYLIYVFKLCMSLNPELIFILNPSIADIIYNWIRYGNFSKSVNILGICFSLVSHMWGPKKYQNMYCPCVQKWNYWEAEILNPPRWHGNFRSSVPYHFFIRIFNSVTYSGILKRLKDILQFSIQFRIACTDGLFQHNERYNKNCVMSGSDKLIHIPLILKHSVIYLSLSKISRSPNDKRNTKMKSPLQSNSPIHPKSHFPSLRLQCTHHPSHSNNPPFSLQSF